VQFSFGISISPSTADSAVPKHQLKDRVIPSIHLIHSQPNNHQNSKNLRKEEDIVAKA
jgi:hypothetical protein